jgi:hypothetical protein
MKMNSQQIDQYLENELSPAERTAFEKQLASDIALREELNLQKRVIEAAKNAGLKMEFGKAIQKRIFWNHLIRWGVVVAIALSALLFYAANNDFFQHQNTITEQQKENNQSIETPANPTLTDSLGNPKDSAVAQKNKIIQEQAIGTEPSEYFEINNNTDTIIETKEGIVFGIPANAFNSANANIQLEIKTAMNAYEIIKNELSTMSNGALLRTGGMFYVNAFAAGKQLTMTKEIAVSVPTEKYDPAMQLFDGVMDANGQLNWINLKPIQNNLRTYEITQLDFYPQHYIPTLKALNKNYRNKKYTDSLYYSFSGFPHSETRSEPTTDELIEVGIDTVRKVDQGIRPDTISHNMPIYQIDPAKIKAIWNPKFNHTILATKEFEERIHFIHQLCFDYVDVYVRNLNKPLYEIDLLCAKLSSGEVKQQFLAFARRRDGGVMIANDMQTKLSIYFQQKTKAYQIAAEKTWANHQAELKRLDNIANTKNRVAALKKIEREDRNFQEELCANLTDAYRQIGVKRICNDTVLVAAPPAKYYNTTINSTGWKNLDVYVFDATTNRQSMTYTDPNTGRTTNLTYAEVKIQIQQVEQFDRLLVYLIPNGLSSFQIVSKKADGFKENLNSLFQYNVVLLAYKGTRTYYFSQASIQPKEYNFSLLPITEEALKNSLNAYSMNKQAELNDEFAYQLFAQQEAIRQLKRRKDITFQRKIEGAIFNCSFTIADYFTGIADSTKK